MLTPTSLSTCTSRLVLICQGKPKALDCAVAKPRPQSYHSVRKRCSVKRKRSAGDDRAGSAQSKFLTAATTPRAWKAETGHEERQSEPRCRSAWLGASRVPETGAQRPETRALPDWIPGLHTAAGSASSSR